MGNRQFLFEKIGLKFFGKAYGKTLATKLAENAAKKGSSKFVQKTIQKSTELLAATPKNAGALYRYTFDLNVDDLVNNQGYSIEVVGGAMDANETPEITAIRETEEEVGYKISSVKKVTTSFLSPGILNEKVHLFIGI